jgi:hypothetical protein
VLEVVANAQEKIMDITEDVTNNLYGKTEGERLEEAIGKRIIE